ncbi:MAG: hypothetical protein M0R17_09285, partial [Candidatus Omnitrophica bacterium]|nr:hypothetical protein [Candidatus Omnitrophota bacterium]
ERKDILMGFIGLNFFEQLYQSNLDILRDLDNKVGNLESYISKTNKYSDANELKLKIEELNTSYNKKEKLIGELNDTLQQYNNEIIEYKSKIVVDCLIDNIDIDSNEDQLIKIKKQISSNAKKEQEIQDKTEEKNKRITDIKYNLSIAGDIDKLKTEETELNAILLKKQQYEKEIETKKVDLKHKIKKMNQLGQLEYDINCKYCMNNIFVKDAIETKKQYATDKEKYNVTLSKYNDIINNLKSYDLVPVKIKNIEDLNKKKIELNTEIFKLDQEKIKLQNSTLDLNNSKITIEKTIGRYNNNLFQIEENKRLNIKISDIQLNINNLNNKIQKIQKEHTVLYSEINLLKQNLIDIEKANTELHELLEQQKLHDLYSIVVKRDGLPYSLLNIIVPQIELLTNNILNQLTNFHFIMKLEDGGIDMRISYDNNTSWSVDLISGMEKFLLSVAVRIALANYSSLSKTNFLIIDEGFGNLDSDNVNSLVQLFEYLKTMFDWVFIVSHLTTIRDMVDSALEVRKDGLYSTLYMN